MGGLTRSLAMLTCALAFCCGGGGEEKRHQKGHSVVFGLLQREWDREACESALEGVALEM